MYELMVIVQNDMCTLHVIGAVFQRETVTNGSIPTEQISLFDILHMISAPVPGGLNILHFVHGVLVETG